ncbi:MAG: hypothetical protein KTR30_08245 [Saprospiraceae bacterium]|nr:hypothetical protein [Saprospiraceae bacterium]
MYSTSPTLRLKAPVIKLFLLSLFVALHWQCNRMVPIDDIERPPVVVEADQAYADVYKPLDGHWKGQFFVFEAKEIGERDDAVLYNLKRELIQQDRLSIVNTLVVDQFYESESPFFQKVKIMDFYEEKGETEVSLGVNKVQDGKMWCVVRKPNETVIHEGSKEGEHTIIWQRNEQSPQRVEYFKETVLPNTYEIIGWGYYEGDDLTKMPKTWFYAQYHRAPEGQ